VPSYASSPAFFEKITTDHTDVTDRGDQLVNPAGSTRNLHLVISEAVELHIGADQTLALDPVVRRKEHEHTGIPVLAKFAGKFKLH
jgi:endonuclease V-like protein UPF0215 family